MPVPLDYGLKPEKTKGVPLDYGLKKQSTPEGGVPLDYGLKKEESSIDHPAFQGGSPGEISGAGGSYSFVGRLGDYVKGNIPGTIPSGIKETYGALPKMMYQPGVEQHPEEAFWLAAEALGIMKPFAKSIVGREVATRAKTALRPKKVIAEPLPKYAGSINLERQNIPKTAKELEVTLAPEKNPISWKETQKRTEKIFKDPGGIDAVYSRLDKIAKGKLTADINAAREYNASSMTILGKITDDIKAGKISAEIGNQQIKEFSEQILSHTADASSEVGRALNIHKRMVGPNRIAKIIDKLGGKLNPRQLDEIAKMTKQFENGTLTPEALDRLDKILPNPKFKDYVLEYWYNSILSGLPTHVVNVASNTGWQIYQFAHRPHVAFWDKLYTTFSGKARSRYMNEMVPMMAGYKTGVKRGAKGAVQMMRKGELADFETKWAQEVGQSAVGAWERSPHAWMRKISPAVSVFTRALRAMDVWANSMAYDAEVNSIVRRLATDKGLKGEALSAFEKSMKKNLPQSIHDQAMKFAKHSTFMDDPDPFTNWLLGIRKVPVIGPASQFVIPFVNTIGNLTKRGLEFTPGIGIAKEAVSRKMGRGLGTPEIISKQVEGSLLALYILHKANKGEITGPAPQSQTERDAFYRSGKIPWGIKQGDTWYSYRRMEPFNTAIASVAIAHDKIVNAKDDATRTEIFGQVARGMVDNLIDSSYFQGLQTVFDKNEQFKTAPFRFGASFVPYSSFWRSINRSIEVATTGKAKVRENEGWLSALAQVIPGLSGKIPAKLNAWGKEKVIPGNIFQQWLPYKWVKESDDVTEKSLQTLGVYPGLPSQYVTYHHKKMKLDDKIYRKMVVAYGADAKKVLDIQFSKPVWQRALKDEKQHDRLRSKLNSLLSARRSRHKRIAIREQLKLGGK